MRNLHGIDVFARQTILVRLALKIEVCVSEGLTSKQRSIELILTTSWLLIGLRTPQTVNGDRVKKNAITFNRGNELFTKGYIK